jgi:hypothetical protein
MRMVACAGIVATNAASAVAVAIAAPANELLIDGRIAASMNFRHVPAMPLDLVISALGNKSASLNYIKISFSVFIILNASNDTPKLPLGTSLKPISHRSNFTERSKPHSIDRTSPLRGMAVLAGGAAGTEEG